MAANTGALGLVTTGAVTLGQIAGRFSKLEIACEKCGRNSRYSIPKLIGQHGADYGLPDLAITLSADCPRRGALTYDRCRVHFPQFKTNA